MKVEIREYPCGCAIEYDGIIRCCFEKKKKVKERLERHHKKKELINA